MGEKEKRGCLSAEWGLGGRKSHGSEHQCQKRGKDYPFSMKKSARAKRFWGE